MQITFRSHADASTPRLVARFVEQDRLPAELDRAAAEGARASRFAGKAGQVFETFTEANGRIERLALVGTGADNGDDGQASLERAGGLAGPPTPTMGRLLGPRTPQ